MLNPTAERTTAAPKPDLRATFGATGGRVLLFFFACATPEPTAADSGGEDTASAAGPAWDAPAATLDCAEGDDAPLLDGALADADIPREELGFDPTLWDNLARAGYVRGPYQMPWFEEVHNSAEHAACFARQAEADLDTAAIAAHPVAAALGVTAAQAQIVADGDPIDAADTTLEQALGLLVDAAGSGDDPARASELPPDLAEALVPIVLAMTEGLHARAAMDEASADIDKNRKLFLGAAGIVLPGNGYYPPITDAAANTAFNDWATGDAGPKALLLPARQLAFAVEDADLLRFAGGDTDWSFATAAGELRISPSTDDTHALEDVELLFHLDLGGDDAYVDGAGANVSEDNPVALTVDLGGDDLYGYAAVGDSHDVDGALVSDGGGRQSSSGYWISDSRTGRQGSGRYGIGLLFDLGGGNDTYSSLRMSQGFGTLGVGVLRDDGGNDVYQAEAGAQGSGVLGWGLLLDGGGDDTYHAWAFSQGFGYVGSIGTLLDAGGDDTYIADPGNSFGGVTLYASPQLPSGEGNSSFCEGAGFGLRGDSYGVYLSGGFGVLRDVSGDDAYENGVFGQGAGYWEGTGLLADGAGNDQYDALYYVQGGAAHFATGLLFDGGGDDRYNQRFDSYYMQTGAGHDYSLGVLVDDGGDDVYGFGGLAVGASNCQGVGVFVDKDGADTYLARSTYSVGLGNHSTECETRLSDPSIGIFVDGGGDPDSWTWTDGDVRTPADDSTFGIAWTGTADEHGGAIDGDGGVGF